MPFVKESMMSLYECCVVAETAHVIVLVCRPILYAPDILTDYKTQLSCVKFNKVS